MYIINAAVRARVCREEAHQTCPVVVVVTVEVNTEARIERVSVLTPQTLL